MSVNRPFATLWLEPIIAVCGENVVTLLGGNAYTKGEPHLLAASKCNSATTRTSIGHNGILQVQQGAA